MRYYENQCMHAAKTWQLRGDGQGNDPAQRGCKKRQVQMPAGADADCRHAGNWGGIEHLELQSEGSAASARLPIAEGLKVRVQ